MKLKRMIQTALVGFVLTVPLTAPTSAQSVLHVLRGATSNNISVSVNRAVVMEADRPFAELSVANPGIADIATLGERTIYVLGKSPGRTTLTILGEDGNLIANVDVEVSPDIAEFKERLRDILPSEAIEVRTANDGIVMSGRVSGARKLSRALELAERYAPGRVTNLMSVGGTQQVMLKVRFAEMSRSVAKSVSSNIGISIGSAGDDASLVSGAGANLEDVFGGLATDFERDNVAGLLGAGLNLGDVGINMVIDALEGKGMVRTLAEPNLVAISGESASFLAGGEFPILIRGTADEPGSIEYKRYGIVLDFRPVVIDDNMINLELLTEVSEIDTANLTAGFPTISTRRASTTVEMRDGQSFAIAGLLTDSFNDSVSQVPWLGDVPVLGALFRSTSFQRRQSELVIIVTPHLVTPTDGELLAMPTDRMRIPNESELFLSGNVAGSATVQDIARQEFQGSYGYVME